MPEISKTRWSDITHLLIDADDTLWENNIHFERTTEAFVEFLDHSTLSREAIQEVLDDFERVNAVQFGYGSAVFARSLVETFRTLVERDVSEADLDTVLAFGQRILEQELELIPHVETTLAQLSRDYIITICTKGDRSEQQMKIDRSGLAHYFHQVEIMPEKDEHAYREITDRLGVRPESSCMVGNSPKSDINPPLALGMHAVFVPHNHTWSLEHQDIDRDHPRLLVLDRFADLLHYF